jgi:hypothetical protein
MQPFVVRVPHLLGKAEATRRIDNGVDRVKAMLPPAVGLDQAESVDGKISIAIHALGQSVTALVAVEDDHVIVEALVPLFLAPFAAKAKRFTTSFGTKLLASPK